MKGLIQHKSDLQRRKVKRNININVDATQIVVALIGAGAVIASAFIDRM